MFNTPLGAGLVSRGVGYKYYIKVHSDIYMFHFSRASHYPNLQASASSCLTRAVDTGK
jgi:hypothetical protein